MILIIYSSMSLSKLVQDRFARLGPNFFAYLTSSLVIFFGLSIILFFRAPVRDEVLYLNETLLMSNLIKSGEWLGNYGVGIHGFIFKIIPALGLIVTGPSVWIPTLFNVLLASVSCVLFYKLLRRFFFSPWLSVSGCVLLATSQRFLLVTPTYLREIPALFALILLLYGILSKWNMWVIGLLLVLLLDAKEYIYFGFAAPYFLWLAVTSYSSENNGFVKRAVSVLKVTIPQILPTLLFFVLMFCTSIIPLNIYIAFITGLAKEKAFIQYSMDYITLDRNAIHNTPASPQSVIPDIIASEPVVPTSVQDTTENRSLLKTLEVIVVNYANKLVSPSSFSLLSIPLVVYLPTLLFALYQIKTNLNSNLGLLSTYHLLYTLLYISQFSQGRYLFPVYISTIILFLSFTLKRWAPKTEVTIFVIAALLTCLQVSKETTFVVEKILIKILLFVLMLPILLNSYYKRIPIIAAIALGFYVGASILVATAYFLTGANNTQGQIFLTQKYGTEMGYKEISTLIGPTEIVVVTDTVGKNIIPFYRNETYMEPEWNWSLKDWVPKKRLLKVMGTRLTYYCESCTKKQLRSLKKLYHVTKFVNLELPGNTQGDSTKLVTSSRPISVTDL